MAPKLEHELFRLNPELDILSYNRLLTDTREKFAADGIDITHLSDIEVVELAVAIVEQVVQTQLQSQARRDYLLGRHH